MFTFKRLKDSRSQPFCITLTRKISGWHICCLSLSSLRSIQFPAINNFIQQEFLLDIYQIYFRVVKKHVLVGLSVFDELDDLIICYKANSPSIFTSWGTKVDEGRYCFLVTWLLTTKIACRGIVGKTPSTSFLHTGLHRHIVSRQL